VDGRVRVWLSYEEPKEKVRKRWGYVSEW